MKFANNAFHLLLLTSAAGCGPSETPKAAPGAVERTVAELDRNEAAERAQTVRKLDREAEARADEAERRIRASERQRLKQD
jgi:hypothetical protein